MTDNTPTLLVMAGPNGSGKSTLTKEYKPIGKYVNPDVIERYLRCDTHMAADIADATCEALLKQHEDFTRETLLSTPAKIDMMRRAKESGYTVRCIYVLTYRYRINVERVRQRKEHPPIPGGEPKIIERYQRAMKLIPVLFDIDICDQLVIYDNSLDRTEGGPERIVSFCDGELRIFPTPIWTEERIRSLLDGTYTGEPESDE